jgi:hypothetical protein
LKDLPATGRFPIAALKIELKSEIVMEILLEDNFRASHVQQTPSVKPGT